MADSLVKVKKILGPTVDGKKKLLSLTTEDKRKVLNTIRKDWEDLIDLHFQVEGGISDGRVYPWKPLSQKHAQFKEDNGYIEDILQMSNPPLPKRYKDSIRTNPSQFEIRMEYPELIHGKKKGIPVTAAIHQLPNANGIPRRRIILKDFKKIARDNLIEYLTNG